MMKKGFVFALATALLLALVSPAAGAESPQPRLETGIVQGDRIPAVIRFLPRGEMVAVTETVDGTFSAVETQDAAGILETQLLALEGEDPYETWTGYAKNNTGIYATYELIGKPLETLKTNDRLQVLDELEDCYIIPYEQKEQDETGAETVKWNTAFVPKDQVSKTPVQSYPGGSSGAPRPQDGGDIVMQAMWSFCRLSQVSITQDAQVKADGAKLILRHYQAGDTVQIVTEQGFAPEVAGYVTILVDGQYAYLPEAWVLRDGEEPFTAKEVYAGYNCGLYSDYTLRGEAEEQLKVNAKVTVLWETEDSCYIQAGDRTGFVSPDAIHTSPVSPASSPAESNMWTPPIL